MIIPDIQILIQVKIDNIFCYNTDENTKCVDIAGLRIMQNGTNIYISKNIYLT